MLNISFALSLDSIDCSTFPVHTYILTPVYQILLCYFTAHKHCVQEKNPHIIYQEQLSLCEALAYLKTDYGCERLTVQSGGTVNGLFLREKLFDYIDIVVAPVLIGGKETVTLIDGCSLTSESELSKLGVLKLMECTVLQDSYMRIRYKVIG